MAFPLESTIMAEIGLGNHYHWYNGSRSCRGRRVEAADKLTGKIQEHHDAGDEIAQPSGILIAMLKRVAKSGETSSDSLTNTWVSASYVIAEHIHQAHSSNEERLDAYKRTADFIAKKYLS